ncbi:MAG: galactose-1-phosphate uridylyltransferase [Candidatus Spechtbacterales bacterium]
MESPEKKKNKDIRPDSELRRDLVTGDWVLVATGRAQRPQLYIKKDKDAFVDGYEDCPFEDPQASGNEKPLLQYKNKQHPDWSLQVIPNKYPAFRHQEGCGVIGRQGIFSVREGRGFHEVIITRDHEKHIALLERDDVAEVVRAYQERYIALKDDECVEYISIFHNHGREAGASLPHPHSQLIAIPVTPSDVRRSLRGSNTYFRRNGRCVHCDIISWELDLKERIIYENKDFVAFCPFVSRTAFEIRIFPKKHEPYLSNVALKDLSEFADALRNSLKMLYDVLDDPSYNFFIHTAPVDAREYPNYHWHVEIIPKTAIWAGFELGTGIEISTIEPKAAAEYLRRSK